SSSGSPASRVSAEPSDMGGGIQLWLFDRFVGRVDFLGRRDRARRQYGTGGLANEPLGNAAEHEVLEAATPVGAHHHQIVGLGLQPPEDGVSDVAGLHHDAD